MISPHSPDLSVVVPTYRGQESLRELVARLEKALGELEMAHEVIIVNDASPDRTWEVLEELARDHPEVRAIDLLTNHGQARATLCGLAHARGELVATMDDDLQHPPEELPLLVHALLDEPETDAAVGSWEHDASFFRNLGSSAHALADRLANGTPPGFRHTGFRLMRRPVADALVAHQTRTPVIGPLLREVTNRVINVPVHHAERQYGESNYGFREGIRIITTNFFKGSTLPLRLMSGLGITCSLLAAIVAVVFLVRWMFGTEVPPGWTSSFLAIVFFGGATLFALGLIGEYMSLIIQEVRRPPQWAIRTILGEDDTREPG